MSTFEALKLAYLRSAGKDEPGVLATLAFGSISGSVGATTVYPLNLVRTRLQASGSTGHPQRYTGVWDVTVKTFERDGWRGFYRGLFPTLAKVRNGLLSCVMFRPCSNARETVALLRQGVAVLMCLPRFSSSSGIRTQHPRRLSPSPSCCLRRSSVATRLILLVVRQCVRSLTLRCQRFALVGCPSRVNILRRIRT